MLKIYSSDILLQEVPGEISLGLSISNCPYKCKFCHTPILQEDVGDHWRLVMDKIVSPYKNAVSCVLFMGGDGQLEDLHAAAKYVKDVYKLKTAVYLGTTEVPEEIKEVFDYIKVGPYVHELGPLSEKTTNQRLYKVDSGKLENLTHLFWREDKEDK